MITYPEKLCVTEITRNLRWEQLATRRTNMFHHIPYIRRKRSPANTASMHLHNKALNTIHTSKNCYKFSSFSKTIKDWNSLLHTITSVSEPLAYFVQTQLSSSHSMHVRTTQTIWLHRSVGQYSTQDKTRHQDVKGINVSSKRHRQSFCWQSKLLRPTVESWYTSTITVDRDLI